VPFLYSVYGLGLQANQPIPGLELQTGLKIDLQIYLTIAPPWLSQLDGLPNLGERSSLVRPLREGAYWQIAYLDGTVFVVDRAGTEIWATWSERSTLEDTATYLLGPILGFVLRLRGIVCLHASAIAVEGQAIAFLGNTGAGKSTTAAALAQKGYAVLSDDIVALFERDGFFVQSGYSRLRLWDASVDRLYGSPDALPCLTPNWPKRYLDVSQAGYQFQPQPLPLAAIYLLNMRTDDPLAPYVAAPPVQSALINLVTNTYANTLLDRQMRAHEFEVLSQLVAQVPVRKITPHADLARLPKLCEVILDDFHSLSKVRRSAIGQDFVKDDRV